MSNESKLAKKLNQKDQEIAELKNQLHVAERKGKATHRCKICGALWIKYGPDGLPLEGTPPSWSLVSLECGSCCDNVEMGDQIEPIGLMVRVEDLKDIIKNMLEQEGCETYSEDLFKRVTESVKQ